MLRVVFVISGLLVLCAADSTLTCPAYERVVKCANDCPSDYCQKCENEDTTCPAVDTDNCPPDSCKCNVNYRRAENGTCIPTRDCPPFKCHGLNEVYNPCPPMCPQDTCAYAPFGGKCPPLFGTIGTTLICNPECRCAEGYWRDDSGTCVPAAECPSMQNTTSTSS